MPNIFAAFKKKKKKKSILRLQGRSHSTGGVHRSGTQVRLG